MAILDGKDVILSDVVEETKKEKPHDNIKDAAGEVFASMPEVINETLRRGKEKHGRDFFIEMLVRIEKFAMNPIHPFLFTSITCPNPKLKQMVFSYTKHDDTLRLMWVLPNQIDAACYRLDPLKYPKENVQYSLDHEAGKLQEIADKINRNIKG